MQKYQKYKSEIYFTVSDIVSQLVKLDEASYFQQVDVWSDDDVFLIGYSFNDVTFSLKMSQSNWVSFKV
jgi:hypothetical protein